MHIWSMSCVQKCLFCFRSLSRIWVSGPGLGLLTGFFAILVLMVTMTLVGLGRMDMMQKRLDSIVSNHMEKIMLVTRMRVAARERTLSLHRMVLLGDLFERDHEWTQFNNNASNFTDARLKLLSLSMTQQEQEILDRQNDSTQRVVPLQERAAGLTLDGKISEARKLLVGRVVPLQEAVLEQLDLLSATQEKAAKRASENTLASYERTRSWMVVMTASAIGLSLMIAIVVVRRTSKIDKKLRHEKERAQVTLYSIGDGVITTDSQGRVESLNYAAEILTGWKHGDALGVDITEVFNIVHDSNYESEPNLVRNALEKGEVVTISNDVVLKTRGGEDHAIEATAAPILSTEAQSAGAVLVFHDVTEMRALSRELGYQACHDVLTGLYNRREFEQRLTNAIEHARNNDTQHALCYIDLDMFKVVNDTCGHAAGDELLRQVSMILKNKVRKQDILARLGGDEFGMLLEACDLGAAQCISEDIRQSIRNFRFIWEDKSFELGVSIGVVAVTPASGNISDLFRAADIACYAAKDRGRNRIHVFYPDDRTLKQRQGEINWVKKINNALEAGLFCLHAQEIRPLDPVNNLGHQYELLIRMMGEGGKLIPPMSFLPAAERYNLMPLLDKWVIRQAFSIISECNRTQGFNIDCFNINLSGQSLSEKDLLPFIAEEFNKSQISPDHVCFEITETAAIANMTRASLLIKSLKDIGCRFALDDFGSGLSSFGYLKNLSVDYVKIDGTFVRDIATDAADLAMVKSINQVSHIMGIKTIAEYVETDAIYRQVTDIGIDYAQGMYIAAPKLLEPAKLVVLSG